MTTEITLLHQATNSAIAKENRPKSTLVVTALLAAEKNARQAVKNNYFKDLAGVWNLRFITGTKQTRKKAGIILGAGKYIPQLVKIKITYETDQSQNSNTGRVTNSVDLGFLNLSLTGPVKFMTPKNILAFDFNTVIVKVFGWQAYHGQIKKGEYKETEFYQAKIGQLAFFSYFLITPDFIAARGKGGGLALWAKED